MASFCGSASGPCDVCFGCGDGFDDSDGFGGADDADGVAAAVAVAAVEKAVEAVEAALLLCVGRGAAALADAPRV